MANDWDAMYADYMKMLQSSAYVRLVNSAYPSTWKYSVLKGVDWNTKDSPMNKQNYYVYNSTVGAMTGHQHNTETNALADAEEMAKRFPGNEYVVLHALTKSVAVKPVTTTRL